MNTFADRSLRGFPSLFARYARVGLLLVLLSGIGCKSPASRTSAQRPFTIAMLPDTQRYSEKRPDLFFAQTNWIKQNCKKENIIFVTHVGDLVQNRSKKPSEWKVADEAMALLDGVVPYGVAIGNHDYDSDEGVNQGVASMYLEHFNPDRRFKGRPGYGGASPNGLNSYHLFSGGGVDFVMLFLEVDAPDDALAWAGGVLERYPTRAAIVNIHTYMNHSGGTGRETKRQYRKDGNSGEEIWQKFIRCHPQVFMVLCGHVGRLEEYCQISQNDAGASVIEMLADYQNRKNGGDGWLRLIRFVPASREIQMRTYSPALNQFETDANSQFTVPWELPAACRAAARWTSVKPELQSLRPWSWSAPPSSRVTRVGLRRPTGQAWEDWAIWAKGGTIATRTQPNACLLSGYLFIDPLRARIASRAL